MDMYKQSVKLKNVYGGGNNMKIAYSDIHTETAKLMFEKDKEEVTDDMRLAAKQINFGLMHGRGLKEVLRDLERL